MVTFTLYNQALIDRASPLFSAAEWFGGHVVRRVSRSSGIRVGRRELVRTLGGGALDVLRSSRTLVSRRRRAVDEVASTRVAGELLAPVHPLTTASLLRVTPAQPHDLDIDLAQTEALLRPGHRLRVTIARTSWPRHILTPALRRRLGRQEVVLDPDHPSWLAFQAADQRRWVSPTSHQGKSSR
ncbi:CocE/NonD family hydrolase C-terminal non-catalytic domain-containing protein [Nocardia yunnanensis]|uniref:CocE/NonD family hydrolase C-terminal non-catalytic domain-containing protein n=1 Tax=Nocardia yunnanensis TaxID=2382165 RepID=UPI0013C4BE96|nr:CocE/NonD family hydrolase C-terminal non-catalytic domain-containing protein [Nocardia yunnanensis]